MTPYSHLLLIKMGCCSHGGARACGTCQTGSIVHHGVVHVIVCWITTRLVLPYTVVGGGNSAWEAGAR